MKKLKPKIVEHKLGDIHTIGNITYETIYINQGKAFLSPLDDYPPHLYFHCVELKLDEYGNILK